MNFLIFNVLLEVLEILLKIDIYFLDTSLIILSSPPNLNFRYLGPLIIELFLQELTRLHIEHDDLFRRELKFSINPLEPGHSLFEIRLLLFLNLLLLCPSYLFESSEKPAILPISLAATTVLKWIGQFAVRNLEHLILDTLDDRFYLELVLLAFDLVPEGINLLFLQLLDNGLGHVSCCQFSCLKVLLFIIRSQL